MPFVKFFVLDRNAVMIYNNTSMIAWYAKKAVSERNYRMKITVRLTALFIAVIMSVALLASCAGDVTDEKGFVLTLDNKTDTYTVTGYKSSGATDITLPSTYNGKAVTAIGKSAFFGSEILESVTIPDSIETVGALAFSNCKKLKKITFDGNSKLKELDTGVFSGCEALTGINLPAGITKIGFRAFSGCSAIPTLALPEAITEIYYFAFADCAALTEVTVPEPKESLTVCANAFAGCKKLTGMGTPYTSADKTDENKYLYKKGTAYLTTEDGKTLAYLLKTDAETFEIPKDIEKVSDGAFVRLTALKSITVAEGNANYTAENGVLYNKDKTTLIAYPAGKTDEAFTLPESVTAVAPCAFAGNATLADVSLPASVKTLGESAFEGCGGLKVLTINAEEFTFTLNSLSGVILQTVNFGGNKEAWDKATKDVAKGNEALTKFPEPSYIK